MIKVRKEAFVVIGKEGSTSDGEGFIRKLWDDANGHFSEVAHLAKKDAAGRLVGIWGAMSDFSHAFKPWEDVCHFSKEEIEQLEEIIRSTAHLIIEFSQEGGFENASNL